MFRLDVSGLFAKRAFLYACAAAGLVVFGGWTFSIEAPFYFAEGWSEQTILNMAADDTVAVPLSTSARLIYLRNCQVALTSATGRVQPSAVRLDVASRCRASADAMTAASPNFAPAWYTGALAAGVASDWAGMNEGLREAYRHGRNEMWQAEARVDLVEDQADHIADDLWPQHFDDLRMLLRHDAGRSFLAVRHGVLRSLRLRLDLLALELPEPDRSRFANMVARTDKERLRSNGRQ
jgi:hypothetical protein